MSTSQWNDTESESVKKHVYFSTFKSKWSSHSQSSESNQVTCLLGRCFKIPCCRDLTTGKGNYSCSLKTNRGERKAEQQCWRFAENTKKKNFVFNKLKKTKTSPSRSHGRKLFFFFICVNPDVKAVEPPLSSINSWASQLLATLAWTISITNHFELYLYTFIIQRFGKQFRLFSRLMEINHN